MLMPEPVRRRDKRAQSGTGMQDVGMPMPAASASMPMPSYNEYQNEAPNFHFLAWSFCTKNIAVIGFGPNKIHLELIYNILYDGHVCFS